MTEYDTRTNIHWADVIFVRMDAETKIQLLEYYALTILSSRPAVPNIFCPRAGFFIITYILAALKIKKHIIFNEFSNILVLILFSKYSQIQNIRQFN